MDTTFCGYLRKEWELEEISELLELHMELMQEKASQKVNEVIQAVKMRYKRNKALAYRAERSYHYEPRRYTE